MTPHYTSLQIKNTAAIPMIISIFDPEGMSGPELQLDSGKEMVQLAPIGTTWRIKFAGATTQDTEELPPSRRTPNIPDPDDPRGTDGNVRGDDGPVN